MEGSISLQKRCKTIGSRMSNSLHFDPSPALWAGVSGKVVWAGSVGNAFESSTLAVVSEVFRSCVGTQNNTAKTYYHYRGFLAAKFTVHYSQRDVSNSVEFFLLFLPSLFLFSYSSSLSWTFRSSRR